MLEAFDRVSGAATCSFFSRHHGRRLTKDSKKVLAQEIEYMKNEECRMNNGRRSGGHDVGFGDVPLSGKRFENAILRY